MRLAKEAGLPQDVGEAYHYLIALLFQQDLNEEAMEIIEEAYSYAERTQTEIFL